MSDSHKQGRALAVLRTCRHETKFSRPQCSTAGAQHRICELYGRLKTARGRDLQKYPRFGFFRPPRGLHEGCYKNAYQPRTELQLASTKVNYVRHGWREVHYFGSRAWVPVQFRAYGLWKQAGQRQLKARDGWRSSCITSGIFTSPYKSLLMSRPKQYIGRSTPVARQPNGVSWSRCIFFRITFRKESGLRWFCLQIRKIEYLWLSWNLTFHAKTYMHFFAHLDTFSGTNLFPIRRVFFFLA